MPLYITRNKITEMFVDAIVSFRMEDRTTLDLIPHDDQTFHYHLRIGVRRDGLLASDWRLGLSTCLESAMDYAVVNGLRKIAVPLAVEDHNAAEGLALAREVTLRFLEEQELTVFLVTPEGSIPLPEDEVFRETQKALEEFSSTLDDEFMSMVEMLPEDFFWRDPELPVPRPVPRPAPDEGRVLYAKCDEVDITDIVLPGWEERQCQETLAAPAPVEPRPAPLAPPPAPAAPGPAPDEAFICYHTTGDPVRLSRLEEWHAETEAEIERRLRNAAALNEENLRAAASVMPDELAAMLDKQEAGFSQTLLKLIDERGMTDPECYRRANMERQLFNKIRNIPGYTPKKTTALALCIALRLDLDQTRELLALAGYALTRAHRLDLIVEYYIAHKVYDVHTINQVLWQHHLPQLGSGVRESGR